MFVSANLPWHFIYFCLYGIKIAIVEWLGVSTHVYVKLRLWYSLHILHNHAFIRVVILVKLLQVLPLPFNQLLFGGKYVLRYLILQVSSLKCFKEASIANLQRIVFLSHVPLSGLL